MEAVLALTLERLEQYWGNDERWKVRVDVLGHALCLAVLGQ